MASYLSDVLEEHQDKLDHYLKAGEGICSVLYIVNAKFSSVYKYVINQMYIHDNFSPCFIKIYQTNVLLLNAAQH